MNDIDAIKAIEDFLDQEEDNSIIFNGNWGIGKTYILKEYIINKYKKNSKENIVYVVPEDLKGTTLKEFCYLKFANLSRLSQKMMELTSKCSAADKEFGAIFNGLNFLNKGLRQEEINNLDLNNKIIIIDELERKSDFLDFKELLFELFIIKEKYPEVKIIISLNENSLEKEDKEIFINWNEKISDYYVNLKESSHFFKEVKKLEEFTKTKLNELCFNIDFSYINNGLELNLRLLKKYKKELFFFISYIKDFKTNDFQYDPVKLNSLFNKFFDYFKLKQNAEKMAFNAMKNFYKNPKYNIFDENIFIMKKHHDNYEKYLLEKHVMEEGMATKFRGWKQHPFEYIKKYHAENSKFIPISDSYSSISTSLNLYTTLFKVKEEEKFDFLIDYFNSKYNDIKDVFDSSEKFSENHFKVSYYLYGINNIENAIDILNNYNFNENNAYLLKKDYLIEKFKKLQKEKESYVFFIQNFFSDKYEILLYLNDRNEHKKNKLKNILKKECSNNNFLNYVLEILDDSRKNKYLPDGYKLEPYQDFSCFYVNTLRDMSCFFTSVDSKKIIKTYFELDNDYDINMEAYFKHYKI
jgi:hypothetical protein